MKSLETVINRTLVLWAMWGGATVLMFFIPSLDFPFWMQHTAPTLFGICTILYLFATICALASWWMMVDIVNGRK